MKNLFNNLLLNSRFVFQNAGEKPQPAPEAEAQKPDEFAKFLENQPPLEQVIAKAKEKKDATQNMAAGERNKAKDQVTSYTTPEGEKIIRLEQVTIEGKVREGLKPEAQAVFDKLMAQLDGAKNDKARAKLLTKFDKQARESTDPAFKQAKSAVSDLYTTEGERLSDAEVDAKLANREMQLAKLGAEGRGREATNYLEKFAANEQMSEMFEQYASSNVENLAAKFQQKMTTLIDAGQYDRALAFATDVNKTAKNILSGWNMASMPDSSGAAWEGGKVAAQRQAQTLARKINTYQA